MSTSDPTPVGGTKVVAKKSCEKRDCPLVERRRSTDKYKPYVDIAKTALLIAMAHFCLKLVFSTGSVVTEIKRQTDLIQDIHDHFYTHIPYKGGK